MEKLTKENKLGETFTWNGHTFEVAEVEDPEFSCSGCYFWEHNKLPCIGKVVCTDDSRQDHRNVIFKEIKTEKL